MEYTVVHGNNMYEVCEYQYEEKVDSDFNDDVILIVSFFSFQISNVPIFEFWNSIHAPVYS